MLRAYSEARCVDYGCSLRDVDSLRTRVEKGRAWCDVAEELAQSRLERGSTLAGFHSKAAAGAEFLQGAACLRVSQSAQEEQPSARLMTYERHVAAFEAAMRLSRIQAEYVEVNWKGVPQGAWLFPYQDTSRWAVVWGGADGWREAYYTSVPFYHAQDLSVCLVELPGQGIARLRDRSSLTADFTEFVSSVLNTLAERRDGPTAFAVVGHSLGGCLAIRVAAADERIRACVTNGGSIEMEKGFTAFPRVLRRFGRMLGESIDDAQALGFIERLELSRSAMEMRADLLCLHGGRDELVRDEEARRLVELHPRATLRVWPDGVHCIYNHAAERNLALTAWISRALS